MIGSLKTYFKSYYNFLRTKGSFPIEKATKLEIESKSINMSDIMVYLAMFSTIIE